MVEYDENAYAVELKEKPICRFCLTQDDALTNIYSTINSNAQVALSMQIMACVSIEVFADDDLPVTICNACQSVMEFCYRFKQMCKKADTLLKQYPLTGLWPEKLNHPKFPLELIQRLKSHDEQQQQQILNQTLKRKLPRTITISKAPKRMMTSASLSQSLDHSISIEDMVVEYADETIIDVKMEHLSTATASPHKFHQQSSSPRSTQPIKILNKQASLKSIEPILREPVITTNDDGKIEVLSEILETIDETMDPIKNAAPVETNVFPCMYCERSFPLRQLLDIHMANHVRDRKFLCTVCKKGFFSKYDLGKHELIHTGEKPFACVVCGKAFSRSTLLRRHEKIHLDQPKFLCTYCERPFLSKDEWEKHTQNHQKRRPYACDYCGKSFAFKQGLERHEVIHSTDQPYKCEHCDQGFSTQGKLARHLTAHAGNRPYPCRICDKSYLLSHHLTRHMRSHKENNQICVHKCSECDLSYSKREDLILHSSVHAIETLVCSLCKMQFETVDDVNEHIRQHSDGEHFACEFCDLIFIDEIQLHEHSDVEHKDEIELYEMANMNEDSIDDGNNDGGLKMELHDDGMIEYTEQIELITADEEPVEVPTKQHQKSSAGKQTTASGVKSQKLPTVTKSPSTKETRSQSTANATKSLDAEKIASPNERSPNTRAASAAAVVDKKPSPAKLASPNNKSVMSTRSNKVSPVPAKVTTSVEKPSQSSVPTVTTLLVTAPTPSAVNASATKKPTLQTSLTNFVTIKSKSNTNNGPAVPPGSTLAKKLIPVATTKASPSPSTLTKLPTIKNDTKSANEQIAPAKIGNKLVKVKQIRMTKAQIEALTKQGKIEMRGGQIIFKDKNSPKKK